MSDIAVQPPRRRGAAPDSLTTAEFLLIANLVREYSGIALGDDKVYLVESRLGHVVRNRRLSGLTEIARRLREDRDDGLLHDVVEAMTTNETLFFRDTRPFEHLRLHALPLLNAERPPTQSLRIWSAAASCGQEPYSIAMTALEAGLGSRPIEILGTDISRAQINRARSGVYSNFEVQRGLPPEHLTDYFRKSEHSWRIDGRVRRLVKFRRWNLMDDLRPLGIFDLVFCRNVLIYFDLKTRRKVLDAIWERMTPGGFLYLPGAETTFGASDRFQPCRGAVRP